MPTTEISGRNLYYEDHGQGDTVLLLHHGMGCVKMWKEIYPGLVENGYRVVMHDRRGYGRSDWGEDFKSFYESDSFCHEAVAELITLLDRFGAGACHVVGQCEGGVIGAKLAAEHPDRVKTLTTSSTQCFSGRPMYEFNFKAFPRDFADLKPELREKFLDWHGPEDAEPFYLMFSNYGGAYGKEEFDIRPLLQKVECPSLVIYPDRSALFQVEQGVAFYRALPAGELAVMPACGHNTYEQRPKEYLGLLLDFLARRG